MKISRYLPIWVLTCGLISAALASTISYTYDTAGRLIGADYGANVTTSYAYDNSGNLLQAASPRPAIEATLMGNHQLLLVWPAFPSGFVLESTTSLSPPISWTQVNPPPTLIGNQNVLTVTITATNQFFRLRKG